jgi:uncharacterized protein DUF4349
MATIGYLGNVRDDLVEAGLRERRRRGRRMPGFRERFSMRSIVAVTSVVTLLAAGTVGWWVTRNGIGIVREAASGRGGAFAEPTAPMASPAPADELGRLQLPSYSVDATIGFHGVEGAPGNAILSELARVIRTAELGLVIPPDSFDERFSQVVDVASAHGGFVANSTTRERSGNVTMRVPAANFDRALRDLRGLGDIEVQRIQGRDVSADYVDLRARLSIAKSRREVLLRLMDRATSIEQTIRVQNALDETQLGIEQVQGQLRLLDDRTSLATIRVNLREEGVEAVSEVDTPSIPNAFERSVAGFVGVIAGVVIGLGYLIPIVLLGALVWFVVVRFRRRRSM